MQPNQTVSSIIQNTPISIFGASCRLPGCEGEAEFCELLFSGGSGIGPVPNGRWNPAKLLHTDPRKAGYSYSFHGGWLRDPFAFDAAVFSLSPREVEQMDPQQRLMLLTVFEALEDACIPPSSLAGQDIGVYVGASNLDHGNRFVADRAAIESHFLTGNTLSVVSNRISHVFDLKGPSFTVDTACSSSMVALNQAVSDIRSGRIDTAIVGGVNVILSPAPYVGFSKASMLSPTGRSQPFAEGADGYVRAEGAVALVISSSSHSITPRGQILDIDVNSDGRTNGIALPSARGQADLLRRIYDRNGLSPNSLAFVEAHGTGTRVGDPIEAQAIGSVLGQSRAEPLTIGSVKSNLGHLEPAAGLTGLLKGLIAAEKRKLPRGFLSGVPNPQIDWDGLNLRVSQEEYDLGADAITFGLSSFGFGGTNAHAIIRVDAQETAFENQAAPGDGGSEFLIVSAKTAERLNGAASAVAKALEDGVDHHSLSNLLEHGRERFHNRLVVPCSERAGQALTDFVKGRRNQQTETGSVTSQPGKLAFVFSGNGVQHADMGQRAYKADAGFRAAFDQVSAQFELLTGSRVLAEDLFAQDKEKLLSGPFVQPLVFAIQYAVARALHGRGITPDLVVGHSLGELATAVIAGGLSIEDALRIVLARAECQDKVFSKGEMAVLAASSTTVEELISDLNTDEVCLAADNSPRSVTITGSPDAIADTVRFARDRQIAGKKLDLPYPFHSPLLDPLRTFMLKTLGDVDAKEPDTKMISSVTAQVISGAGLESEYWWDNLRQPVLFRQAIQEAASQGARCFVEIGPKIGLTSSVTASLQQVDVDGRAFHTLSDKDPDGVNPLDRVEARLLAHGVESASKPRAVFKRDHRYPKMAWETESLRSKRTSEFIGLFEGESEHQLLGSRERQGSFEFRAFLDLTRIPYLADHVVDGEVLFPATAFVEMMLVAGERTIRGSQIALEEVDFISALSLSGGDIREVLTSVDETGGVVEIKSRLRLSVDDWTLHARGRIVPDAGEVTDPPECGSQSHTYSAKEIYEAAAESHLNYGSSFRLAKNAVAGTDFLRVALAPTSDGESIQGLEMPGLHPASLDASMHALALLIPKDERGSRIYLPSGCGRVRRLRSSASITGAIGKINRAGDGFLDVSLWLHDQSDAVVVQINNLILSGASVAKPADEIRRYQENRYRLIDVAGREKLSATLVDDLKVFNSPTVDDDWIIDLFLNSYVFETLDMFASDGLLNTSDMTSRSDIDQPDRDYLAALLSYAEDFDLAQPTDEQGGWRLLPQDLPDSEKLVATLLDLHAERGPLISHFQHLRTATRAFLMKGFQPTFQQSRLRSVHRSSAFCSIVKYWLEKVGQALEDIAAATNHKPQVKLLAQDGDMFAGYLASLPWLDPIRCSFDGTSANGTQLSQDCDLQIAIVDVWQKDALSILLQAASQVKQGGLLALFVQPLSKRDQIMYCLDQSIREQLDIAGATIKPCRITGDLKPAGFDLLQTIPLNEVGTEQLLLFVKRQAGSDGRESVFQTLDRDNAELPAANPVTTDDPSPKFPGLVEEFTVHTITASDTSDSATLAETLMGLKSALVDAFSVSLTVLFDGLSVETRGGYFAVRSFLRTAINEFPNRELKLIALESGASLDRLDECLVLNDSEVIIHADGGQSTTSIDRMMPKVRARPGDKFADPGLELVQDKPGRLAALHYASSWRNEPEPDEVEVEISGTGVNFRDVMLALGLLNKAHLVDGIAGSVFGLEFAGHVSRVGQAVTRFAVGDPVFGLSGRAFASHVTVPERNLSPVPDGMSTTVAAVLPVPFLTAWYALVVKANLQEGETVLIHGGAGGVGLAAIQIARDIGAKIVASLSSEDKESVARFYGADDCVNSRDLQFADTLIQQYGGVDVVLNSLSGEAMRASLRCLKPFGRFLELGKRDFVENSQIGVRGLRQNVSYHAIDLDQLAAHRPDYIQRGFDYVVDRLTTKTFLPLPVQPVLGDHVGHAFSEMKEANHIGRIVVKPPDVSDFPYDANQYRPSDGTHIVFGGTKGFGLQTALWLGERGAKRIVLASRSGEICASGTDTIEQQRRDGVDFVAETVDVADSDSVGQLFSRHAEQGAITGVWLSAMVLEDQAIENLEQQALINVLRPKVDGALNCHRASLGHPVEEFVLFSSISATIGNPGQAAYAAANGYLEGLAEQRREAGLPALAVAWGAIRDTGALQRDADLSAKVERLTGSAGMSAQKALDVLDAILAEENFNTTTLVGNLESGAMSSLPVYKTTVFSSLRSSGLAAGGGSETLRQLIEGLDEAEALSKLVGIVIEEVARILKQPPDSINAHTSFSDLGLDSLMGLDLALNFETRYGFELSGVTLSSLRSPLELAKRLYYILDSETLASETDQDDLVNKLVSAHDEHSAARN